MTGRAFAKKVNYYVRKFFAFVQRNEYEAQMNEVDFAGADLCISDSFTPLLEKLFGTNVEALDPEQIEQSRLVGSQIVVFPSNEESSNS